MGAPYASRATTLARYLMKKPSVMPCNAHGRLPTSDKAESDRVPAGALHTHTKQALHSLA